MGQPRVPPHPRGQHGWGQRCQLGDPHLPALLFQPTVGNWGGWGDFPPEQCLMEGWTLHGPHQCHTAGDSDCARHCHPDSRGSGVLPDHGRFGHYRDCRWSRVCPVTGGSEEALRIGARVFAARSIQCGVPLDGLRWFEAGSYGHKASSMPKEKSSLPAPPPAAFPLWSLPRAFGWGYFPPPRMMLPKPYPWGLLGCEGGVHASCPARYHRMAPSPRGTGAHSHSAKGLGCPALP